MVGDPAFVNIHTDDIPQAGTKHQQISLLLVLKGRNCGIRVSLLGIETSQQTIVIGLVPAEHNDFPIVAAADDDGLIPNATMT